MRAVSRGLVASAEGRKEAIQELTTRVDAFEAAEAGRVVRPAVMLETLKLGQRLNGCAHTFNNIARAENTFHCCYRTGDANRKYDQIL